MFRAACGPSRTACCAVAGIALPVRASMIHAQSPSAQTRSSPGIAKVASGRIHPPPSTDSLKRATTGCGALPTVLTTVAVAMTVPSSSSTWSASTRVSRRLRTSWTPALASFFVAWRPRRSPNSDNTYARLWPRMTFGSGRVANVRRAVWMRSTSSAATSTPVDPPPTTTKFRSARCRSGSVSLAASSSIERAWLRR